MGPYTAFFLLSDNTRQWFYANYGHSIMKNMNKRTGSIFTTLSIPQRRSNMGRSHWGAAPCIGCMHTANGTCTLASQTSRWASVRDSTASLDSYNSPTFVYSTCSSAGGIPLGVIITSGESEATITEAVSLLKSTVLPPGAFYGRENVGPEMCITDDSAAERAALRTVWPTTILLLCIFHYLQRCGLGCGTQRTELHWQIDNL